MHRKPGTFEFSSDQMRIFLPPKLAASISILIDAKFLLNRKRYFCTSSHDSYAASLNLGPDVCEAPFSHRPKSNCHTLNRKQFNIKKKENFFLEVADQKLPKKCLRTNSDTWILRDVPYMATRNTSMEVNLLC